jgi:hypothetical protein
MLRCWSSLFRVAAVACAEPPNATPLIDMSNSSSEIIGAKDFALVICTARATTSRIATHGRSLQALFEFCERFLILAASMRKDGGTRSVACHQGRHLTARLFRDCGNRMPPAVAAQTSDRERVQVARRMATAARQAPQQFGINLTATADPRSTR